MFSYASRWWGIRPLDANQITTKQAKSNYNNNQQRDKTMAKTALGYFNQGDKINYNLNGMAEKRIATYVTRWDTLITAIDQHGNRVSLLANRDRVRPHIKQNS